MNKSLAIIVLLLMHLAFVAEKSSAMQDGAALRQIFNWQNLPHAYSEMIDGPKKSFSFQTLLRYWNNLTFSRVRLKTAFEFNQLYSQTPIDWGFNSSKKAADFKAFKTSAKLLSRNKSSIGFDIERFDLHFSSGKFDFQLGRQPISLGTSHFVSVLDVVAPFHPGYLDGSYKPGVDALRIRTFAGETGEMELIGIAADQIEHSALMGRYRNTFANFDIELVAGQFRKRKFLGIGWEGERRKVNIWGEAAVFQRKQSQDAHLGGFSNDLALSFIAGCEKDIGKDWRGGISYLHQDFGADKAAELVRAISSAPFTQGWMHLSGKSYFLVSANREMSPLSHLNINGMINLHDKSTLWQPVINLSTGNESDIAFYAWLKTGKNPVKTAFSMSLESEFGTFSTGAGFIYRRYF
ncbi:MAG: hypothetical protein PWR01_2144 [Clostridiales bacterium]|nr:hypothetical protein [Clostridiales bacterium]MDN5281071.1 hypothetical protein [Candidatus Ozemobacter sp.]